MSFNAWDLELLISPQHSEPESFVPESATAYKEQFGQYRCSPNTSTKHEGGNDGIYTETPSIPLEISNHESEDSKNSSTQNSQSRPSAECVMPEQFNWEQATSSCPTAEKEIFDADADADDDEGDLQSTQGRHRPNNKGGSSSHSSSSLSSSTGESQTFGCSGYQKPNHLQKNRIAASKCRTKKKRETAKLQAVEKSLKVKRDALKCMVDSLRIEVLDHKNEILRHGMCDCSVIQKYIVETARQIS
ncbi:uncharacterized protein GGS25DRAFT_519912 [Hypoxylon fragiforme]|uniref:uncharacterized protein n=1 Tax=Hypoxylon fragiforme TaxID=63214 RepID=UPI0020C63FA3|nr:uncharacterized protein GGS25DRAFT_519912 [Hypoxylon fragiforme]KAI2611603.1 hypothetical protein GGS25DRAFT_519912 [Hypoxylon fragiforme]